MDRHVGSVQAEMRQNGGRLTLEQILRSGIASKCQYLVILSSYFSAFVMPVITANISHCNIALTFIVTQYSVRTKKHA